jgi:hypothetical protein
MTNKKYSKKKKSRCKNKTNKKFKKSHLKGSGKQDIKHKHNHTLKSTPIELSKVNCSPKDKKEIVDEVNANIIKKVSDFTLNPEDGEMINEQ